MYCSTGLCRPVQRFSFERYVVGRSVVKPLVRAFFVEVAQVIGNTLPGLGHRVVGALVNFFLFKAAPQTLHVHIVQSAALAVHGDTHAVRLECTRERLRSKLRSLVRVEHLRRSVADNGLDAERGVERVREPVCKHLAAVPVDHGCEIKKAFRHRDVRNVRRIDLAGFRHLHVSEQVGVDLVPLPGDDVRRFG